MLKQTVLNVSNCGGLGGKCKTMFTQAFISSPGGLNQLGSKLCRVSLNKKEKTLHRSGLQGVCYEVMVYPWSQRNRGLYEHKL